MSKIGVIGAGTMGQGIAQAFAAAGNQVTVCDIKIEWAQNGINKIGAKLDKLVSRGKIAEDAANSIKANLTAGESDYSGLADVDFVVEAVLEQVKVKQDLFKTLDGICKDSTIFCSNTSSLSITEIANGVKHEVIGMHFFNPADRMKLIEVIRGGATKDETVQAVKELSEQIGKTPVEVNEAPGFVVNRILVPLINEGVFVLQEGVASAKDIDTAMKLGANHPMGPLELGDLIGLDIVLDVMDVLYNETGDSKYRACTLLRKMVRAGKLGRKTGEGFYKYN